MLRWVMVAMAGAGLLVSGCSRLDRAIRPDPLQEVLVVIDGQTITQSQLITDLEEHGGHTALTNLMLQVKVEHEAAAHHVTVDQARYDEEWSKLQARVKDPYQLDYEARQLRMALLVRGLVLQGIPEAARRQFYDKFKDDLKLYDVSQLLVGTEAEAENAARDIARSGDFASVARQLSEDDPSRADGGHVGLLNRSNLKRIFGNAAAASIETLEPSLVSEPLHSIYGYHLVKVSRILQTYDELRSTVEDQLVYAKQGTYLEKLGLALEDKQPPYIIPPGHPPIPTGVFIAASGSPTTAVFVAPSGSPSTAVFAPPSGSPTSAVFAPVSGSPSTNVFDIPHPETSATSHVFDIPGLGSGSPSASPR